MRKSQTFLRAAGAAALAILGIAIPSAEAQLPTLCPLSATDFTKTVRRVAGPGPIQAGDDIEYELLLCNSGPTACISSMSDNLDNLLTDATDIDKVNMPGTVGCNGTPTWDGGTLCQKGPRLGPFVAQPTTQCGTMCDAAGNPPVDPDNLAFRVDAMPANMLQPGQCYRWTIRAHVRDTIASSRCLCNSSQAPIDFMGGTRDSNDPGWTSLEDPTPPIAPGCTDAETCGVTGQCRTCLRIDAEVNLGTSTKCVDTTSPCGTAINKNQGAAVRYLFNIVNTGSSTATDVLVGDQMTFISDLMTPCLDLSTDPVVSPPTCLPGPCPPGTNIAYNPGAMALNGLIPSIAAGESVAFTIDTTVNMGAAGTCNNIWTLQYGTVPMTIVTVQPVSFIVRAAADLSSSDKCIEEGASCVTTTTRAPGSAVRYNLHFVNTGTLDAVSMILTDDLRNLGPTCGVVPMANATCTADVATCGAATVINITQPTPTVPFQATVDRMAPGCFIDCVLNATVNATATGQCCNVARVDYNDPNGPSNYTTGQACFDASGPGGPQLAVTKTTTTPSVTPGSPFSYDIEVRNNGTGPLVAGSLVDTFTAGACQNLTCASFSFVSGSGTCPVTCSGTGPFTLAGIGLTTGQNCIYRITGTAGATPGSCSNTATANPAFGATPSTSVVTVTNSPGLTVTKTVSPSSVMTGGSATFTVTVTAGPDPLTNCVVTDDLSTGLCMTLDSGRCGSTPPILPNPSPGMPGWCGSTPNVVNPTFNLAAGASQEITIPIDAGATEQACPNSVSVTCDGLTGPVTETANRPFTISNSSCDLNGATLTISPVNPAKATIYAQACTAPADPRVDPASATGFVAQPAVLTADRFGSLTPATPGELTLYQLDCACVNVIRLFKDNAANRVAIDF